MWSDCRGHHLTPDQNEHILQPTLQKLPSQLTQAMNPFARLNPTQGPAYKYSNDQFFSTYPDVETGHPAGSRDQLRESTRSAATINDRPASPASGATYSSDMSLKDISDYPLEMNSDSDDASVISDESDETSATDDTESMETEIEAERQQPQLNQASFRQQNACPYHRDSSHGPYSRRKSHSHRLDRRQDRNYPIGDQFEVPPARILRPRLAERARSGSVTGKTYLLQLMNDNEIRSRILDHREASLGHREQWLKRTFCRDALT
ncbi:hypothetical protein Pdw03_3278 [Penicillium digitatum]|uniref:Uncharacterized protein n=1 Tax=Penicillium digitatum TaxID=36651 RepID=A0A7T6XFX9_PENDI|nr:hypothetical protein Pdw03_3278 [Penicillium digitatum]